MTPSAKLFTHDAVETAILTADPCLVLIENSVQNFGVLLANGCRQNSWSGEFILEDALYFRASRTGFCHRLIPETKLSSDGKMFAAIDMAQNRVLPNRSWIPYVVCFLSQENHASLLATFKAGKESILFKETQQFYGRLPGFAAIENTLTTPPDYASIDDDTGLYFSARNCS